jgi:hypothetical protein
MKTTLDLPDDLMREIKVRAAREDRKLKDLMAELLRLGLASDGDRQKTLGHRVKLPLIHTAHPAPPGEELTPERVAEILLQQEVDWLVR